MAIYYYVANRSMGDKCLYNSDGDFLIGASRCLAHPSFSTFDACSDPAQLLAAIVQCHKKERLM